MPRQREEILNAQLGSLLIDRHPAWNEQNVHIDSTDTIRGDAKLKIDVLVENPGGQPVAIETKFDQSMVGRTLRKQVEDRIGLVVNETGKTIESGVSVVFPKGLTSGRLKQAKLRYAVHQLVRDSVVKRWHVNDDEWMHGTVDDLADAVEAVSLSEKLINESEELLSSGVQDASSRLDECQVRGSFGADLASVLHQSESQQTTRMAVSIVVNAFVFHYAIEGHSQIPDVLAGHSARGFQKRQVLETWQQIIDVNYVPIFSVATDILTTIPTRFANPLLDSANEIAEKLLAIGATTFHDLAARMFQTLISDRKFLATFYTHPESAELLAELAVRALTVDWSEREQIESLKIADFACGTGTLLSATQRVIYRRLRRAGLNDESLHKAFMEKILVGTDIMPSAAHLCASMLSSAHPSIGYLQSLVRVLPYGTDTSLSEARGLDSDKTYLGALDLLGSEFAQNIFTEHGIGTQVELGGEQVSGSKTERVDTGRDFPIEHSSFDLVIMNPPFTRPTNHESTTVPVPSFAGFDNSAIEQAAMSKELRSSPSIFGHGNAGLGSNFMDLAHTKLKPGGVMALVLPFTFLAGKAWRPARESLERHYRNIQIVSIATTGSTRRAFSADTGMAECLIVATKNSNDVLMDSTATYANLPNRPKMFVEAQEFARQVCARNWIEGPLSSAYAAGIRDLEIGHTMVALSTGKLVLPREQDSVEIPIAPLSLIAERGKLSRDINGTSPRGSFDIVDIEIGTVPTYPALWKHRARISDGATERGFVVQPDKQGIPRRGQEKAAAKTWHETNSRLHHTIDFQLNSQSLTICKTPEPSLGGRAWPNLKPFDPCHEAPLLIWGNSTLGLMQFWWQGTRQQQGRASVSLSRIPELYTLDATRLSSAQLKQCYNILEVFLSRRFLPANEAYRDDTRKDLDAALLSMLGLPSSLNGPLSLLRLKWCSEPSVHGGKPTRPPTPQ